MLNGASRTRETQSLVFPKPQRALWKAARLRPYRDQMTEVWLVAGAQQRWEGATVMSPKTAAGTLRLAQPVIQDTSSIFKNRERFSTYFKLWRDRLKRPHSPGVLSARFSTNLPLINCPDSAKIEPRWDASVQEWPCKYLAVPIGGVSVFCHLVNRGSCIPSERITLVQ